MGPRMEQHTENEYTKLKRGKGEKKLMGNLEKELELQMGKGNGIWKIILRNNECKREMGIRIGIANEI